MGSRSAVSANANQIPGFAEGLFTVQDITASKPVRNLEFRTKNDDFSILDLCAAPGTKTTQLAELTGDSAEIVATDIDNKRLEMIKENVTRLGIKSVKIIPYEHLFNCQFSVLSAKCDWIFLDVPCSNSGVLSKRIEVRYRITPKAIKKLSETQTELLESAGIIAHSANV